MASNMIISNYYAYSPSHVLPIIFSVLIGGSLLLHAWQNFHYRFWKVTFFMFWGGLVFTAGWVIRVLSSYHPGNLNLYIAQYVLILAAPPIYAAAEYNILGRLMHYLPMHAPLNPSRLVYIFIYLGALVETLTAAGSARLSAAKDNVHLLRSGSLLVSIAVILQALLQCLFVAMVATLHRRCALSGMENSKVRSVCIMLYGTSTLVFVRCIYRAVEKFTIYTIYADGIKTPTIDVLRREWFLYVFDAGVMMIYTYWINIIHPGKYLPVQTNVYLDLNQVERVGPGWADKRPKWKTYVDIFDLEGLRKSNVHHDKYWERPQDWPKVTAEEAKD